MAGDWAYWLIGLGVIAINAALVYLAWWALFADRSKGRRRCPKCWYDMAYAPPPGMRCAECGYTAQKEKQFHRTRRRFGLAIGAIMVSAAICLYVSERATNRGFSSLLPTRLLLWIVPLSDVKSSTYKELMVRMQMGRLSDSHWRSVLERAAEGDAWHEPPSEPWLEKYGALIWRERAILYTKPELERPLFGIPPRVDISARETWPQGMPVTVLVNLIDWWPYGMECRIEATPRVNGNAGEPITFFRTADVRFQRTPFALHLPSLEGEIGSEHEIEIQLNIERRRWQIDERGLLIAPDPDTDLDEGWERVGTHTGKVTVKLSDEMPQAVNNEEMLRLMQQTFSQGVVRWRDGRSPVRFSAAIQSTFVNDFDDTAVGINIDLLFDGQIARRLSMWWLAGTNTTTQPEFDRRYGYEVQDEIRELLLQTAAEDPRWQIRVQSDPQLALRAGMAAKMWKGEFTVPLRLTVRQDTAPPRPWRIRR